MFAESVGSIALVCDGDRSLDKFSANLPDHSHQCVRSVPAVGQPAYRNRKDKTVARMQAAFLRLPGAGSLEKYPGLRRLVGRLILLAVVATMFASTGEAEEDELAKLSAQSDIDYNTGRYSEAVPVADRKSDV